MNIKELLEEFVEGLETIETIPADTKEKLPTYYNDRMQELSDFLLLDSIPVSPRVSMDDEGTLVPVDNPTYLALEDFFYGFPDELADIAQLFKMTTMKVGFVYGLATPYIEEKGAKIPENIADIVDPRTGYAYFRRENVDGVPVLFVNNRTEEFEDVHKIAVNWYNRTEGLSELLENEGFEDAFPLDIARQTIKSDSKANPYYLGKTYKMASQIMQHYSKLFGYDTLIREFEDRNDLQLN